VLIVDSLRASALGVFEDGDAAHTPFLDRFAAETVFFRRAHATECWTLPTHLSIFTGRLPSEHGAHFQHMGYTKPFPTIGELFAEAGYETEIVTRNPVFEGTLPGVTRGFQRNTRILSAHSRGLNPLALMLAASKPRFRRQVRDSGFFHPLQAQSRQFVTDFARSSVPADRELLTYLLERLQALRQAERSFFLFANLFDVHAPYPPTERSIFRPWRSLAACEENLTMPFVLPALGGHRYLRPGFRLSERSRRLLLGRYLDAVALMDQKLQNFFAEANRIQLLDDTLVVLTSDHGEAFGEHHLYLHDASVYQTHLHVPLYVRHPALPPHEIDDVVSTKDLFGLLERVTRGATVQVGTILDPAYRQETCVALAEHWYYPHAPQTAPRYRQNLRAAVSRDVKAIRDHQGLRTFRLDVDAGELHPVAASFDRPHEQFGRTVPPDNLAAASRHLTRVME
jgi:arylsulfatase A-like enzyme